MFVQIHMLQSMPPGNLNRDDTGQPKKCIFGGVTRGRISSQCLKRNIRHSIQFKEAFGDALADRTTHLPRMVADELRGNTGLGVPDEELNELMRGIANKFKKEKRSAESQEEGNAIEGDTEVGTIPAAADGTGQTGQLVFFPPPFAHRIAELVGALRRDHRRVYDAFLGRKLKPKLTNEEESLTARFVESVATASKRLTVDIGLFGRMTTSDLVVNVEAACQVAHAISTHETIIESDYFTAMDDRSVKAGAAFMGSGETETFFDAAVYYKYLNLDVDALQQHLPSLDGQGLASAASVLVSAAALANPTGKQNGFASHSVPELILIEISRAKRPVSYANAFLQAVEGANLMDESARAMQRYVDSIAAAFAPPDVKRILLAVGHAKDALDSPHIRVDTLDDLVKSVGQHAVSAKVQASV